MMKVSVCVPTFNHEPYIAQMLEGALQQKTTFSFEIVIGDDASTDNAPAIIRHYAKKYPERIRAYLHPTNLGPTSPREFAGRNNVLFLLKACRGEYVALCEGDDYWTDPHKLQKQVEYLEAHPDYAICHHNVRVTYEDGSPEHLFNSPSQKTTSTVEDLLRDHWFMATGSLLYRNYFLTHDFADWHAHAAAGDWALVIQLAARGSIGYLPDVMGVYRKHRGGLSHVHASTNAWFVNNRREMFENINAWLAFGHSSIVEQTLKKYQEQLRLLEGNTP